MTPEDIRQEIVIDALDLSPDGELVAYSRRSIEDDEYRTDLWAVPFGGGEPRRLTTGPGADTKPRFSPTGRMLAFLSDRENETAQLYVLPMDGGEAARLTSFPRGVTDLCWLPSEAGLAVLAHDDLSPWCSGERDLPGGPATQASACGPAAQASAGGPVRGQDRQPTARFPGRLGWREDGKGLLEHPTHVHLVTFGGEARRLTSGPWFASCLRVSPDGDRVAFLCDRRPEADLHPMPQVHAVAVEGGEPFLLTDLPGPVSRFSFDADGAVCCLAHGSPMPTDDDPPVLYRVAEAGRRHSAGPVASEVRPLTAGLDRFVDEEADLRDERAFLLADRGRVLPCQVLESKVEPLVEPELLPVAEQVVVAGGRAAAVMTLGRTTPTPDVYALDRAGPRPLTSAGRSWLPAVAVTAGELQVDAPGGAVQTFVFSPQQPADRPLATVLVIHGGPTWAWPLAPDLDTLMLVSAGYRVVRPNIRGSYDRGTEWVRALVGHWGEVDAEDCHAVLDHLVESGLSDPARLGCLGNSYGGFLTNWLVSTCDRFAAAVSQNGVTNQVSAFGNSDCGPQYDVGARLGDATSPEGVARLWQRSPLSQAANVHTPLLILQAEDDLRCPPADAEQLFVTLRWLQRPVQYVLYPGSSHGFAHDGRPDRRVDRARRYLAWFAQHMAP
ncbi:MAG: prolyl oligopeptidase family serine peptidase [Acidimicrobiales bacterium]